MKKNLFLSKGKGLLLSAFALTVFSPVQAQNVNYFGHDENHYYQSVTTIYRGDPSEFGEGYAIANTLGKEEVSQGEVLRTDPTGRLNRWQFRYWDPSNRPVRFTHIEKIYDPGLGSTAFLVVGTVSDPDAATTNLLVLVLDDGGNVHRANEYPGLTYPHLVGTKGIATRDGKYFAVVGFEGKGFDVTDEKHAFIVKLDFFSLAIVSSLVINTQHVLFDHDIATSLAEGANSNQFVIVGSSNKLVDPAVPTSSANLITHVFVDPSGPFIIGFHNFSTDPTPDTWDGSADVVYDGVRDFWVLSNSSRFRYYNLTRYDGLFNGVTTQIFPTQEDEIDYYGYELKTSLVNNRRLLIGGWKNAGGAVFPFLSEYDIPSQAILWEARYGTGTNGMASFVTNPWLYVEANNNLFPYYYNSIATHRSDRQGSLAILESENTVGLEYIKFWWGIGATGQANEDCGYIPQRVIAEKIETLVFSKSEPVKELKEYWNVKLEKERYKYEEPRCGKEFHKNGQVAGIAESQAMGHVSIYPNPSAAVFQVNSETAISEVAVIDISLGKRLLTQKAENAHSVSLDLKDLAPGVYLLQVSGTNHELSTHKITIVR